jgi:hypothetical protein
VIWNTGYAKSRSPYEGFWRTEAIRRKRQYEPAHLVHWVAVARKIGLSEVSAPQHANAHFSRR